MDRAAWWPIVHSVAESDVMKRLSMHPLQFIKQSQTFRTSPVAQMVKCLPTMWESWVQSLGQEDQKWQPTSVLLPGKFHGRRSLVGYSPWGRKELDTTE